MDRSKAAGTRQQLNYTGINNPLAPKHFNGPNNLGSEALQMYNSMINRQYTAEDFLLYIAGLYNSQLAEDYLDGGGGNVLHIPLDPEVLDFAIVDAIVRQSRYLRNLHWLKSEIECDAGVSEELAAQLLSSDELSGLGFALRVSRGGRFLQKRAGIQALRPSAACLIRLRPPLACSTLT